MDDDDDIQSHSNTTESSSPSPSPPPPNGRITVTVPATATVPPPPPPQQTDNSLALVLPTKSKANGSGGGGREDCWSEGATAVLIDAWGERYLELSRGNLKQKHWKDVAEIVSSREDYSKSAKTDIQCKNRIDTVKKKYKLEKAKMASGGGVSSWPFFDPLDRLIGSTARVPAVGSDSKFPVAIPVRVRSSSRRGGSNQYHFRRNQNMKARIRKWGKDDDDDDDEEEQEKPNLPPSKPSKPDSESDSETDSEDTESTQPPSPSLSGFTIKPISPKRKPGPKLEQPKKENDEEDKKAKRGAGTGGGGPQRLWSDEDEIVMLNGMVEYQIEKGKNPFADNGDFHGFLKKSLHVDATNNQFLDKIRRLKKKYFTDVEKNEKEIDEIFSKPHDLECVELAKKIWGAGGIEMGKKGNFNKKNVSTGGGGGGEGEGGGGVGGRGITLALAKKGNEEANEEKGKLSVKKGKRGSNEEVKVEGKEGDLKKKRQGLDGEAVEGEAGNVKKGKRGLSEEADGEGKGKDGKKERGKRVLSEEVIGERKGKGGKKEKQAANNDLSGGEDANVKKQKRVVNGEWKESSMKMQKAVENEEVEGGEGSEDLWDKYPYLRSSLLAEDLPEDVKERAMMMLGKVPEEKLLELEREWRSLMNAKLEVFMMENDLIAKQMKLALDALKSQDY